MLKAELTTVPILIEAIQAWQGYGTRLAVRAARLMREGVDSYGDPDAAARHRTLERVQDALRERDVRLPSRFKNEWRRHFSTMA